MWQSQSLCVGWLKPISEIQYWGNDPEILSIQFSSQDWAYLQKFQISYTKGGRDFIWSCGEFIRIWSQI